MLPCLDFIFSNSSICFCLLFSSSSCLRSSSSYEVSRLKDFLLLISRCCSFMGEARDLLFLTGEVGLEVRRLGSGSGGSSMLTVGKAVAIAVKKKLTFKPTALKVLWNSDLCWSFLAFLYFCFPSKQYANFFSSSFNISNKDLDQMGKRNFCPETNRRDRCKEVNYKATASMLHIHVLQ